MSHAYFASPTLPAPLHWAERLIGLASGVRALVGLGVFVVFSATILPQQASVAATYSGGLGTPDTTFWYSRDQLYAWAEAYGQEGRDAFVLARLTFDVAWPIVYTAALVLVLGWLLQRASRAGDLLRLTVLLPVAAILLDYAENLCNAVVLHRWPEPTDVLATVAPVFTALKWTTLTLALVSVVVVAVLALVRRGRTQSDNGQVYQPHPRG